MPRKAAGADRETPSLARTVGPRVARLDRRLYPGFCDNWDDERFRSLVLTHLRPDMRLLDLGAGAGLVGQMGFRGSVAWVAGIDPDERVLDNPLLDEARVGTGDAIPYPERSFDLVVCDNVLEHLDDPGPVFCEVWRVLKPGGLFLAKTPNKWHYVAILARLTPYWFHRFFNRLRGRPAADTFPTRYRVNSRKAIERTAREAGFLVREITLVEGRPEYLRVAAVPYLLGWLYERAVNSWSGFEGFRCVITAVLEKPGETPRANAASRPGGAR